jgi:hypothetical protein
MAHVLLALFGFPYAMSKLANVDTFPVSMSMSALLFHNFVLLLRFLLADTVVMSMDGERDTRAIDI